MIDLENGVEPSSDIFKHNIDDNIKGALMHQLILAPRMNPSHHHPAKNPHTESIQEFPCKIHARQLCDYIPTKIKLIF